MTAREKNMKAFLLLGSQSKKGRLTLLQIQSLLPLLFLHRHPFPASLAPPLTPCTFAISFLTGFIIGSLPVELPNQADLNTLLYCGSCFAEQCSYRRTKGCCARPTVDRMPMASHSLEDSPPTVPSLGASPPAAGYVIIYIHVTSPVACSIAPLSLLFLGPQIIQERKVSTFWCPSGRKQMAGEPPSSPSVLCTCNHCNTRTISICVELYQAEHHVTRFLFPGGYFLDCCPINQWKDIFPQIKYMSFLKLLIKK